MMEVESQRSKSCLFCQEETFLSPSEIEIKKEVGVDGDLILGTPTPDLPSIVKVQLKPMFIVRKLLDIPEEKCAQYLQQNDGKNSPSSWFVVCQSCIATVEDGYKIYNEMKRLEHNLERIKVKLKRLLLVSSKRGDCDGSSDFRLQRRTRRSKELDKERDFVQVDIRKFVTDQDTTEVNQQQTNENVELLRVESTNITVTQPQSSGEESDDGAHNVNDNDTEWQPVSDGGESADEPILNITLSADTSTSVRTFDKPVIPRPVKKIWLQRCNLCVASFKDRKAIDAHMALHSKNEGLPCTQCGWLCSTARSLEFHCVKYHNKARRPKESWRPVPKNSLSKFEYKAKEDIPFYCDHCHMIFITKVLLLRHIKIHRSDIKCLPCSLCDSTFPTKQILGLHCEEEHQTSSTESREEMSTEESLTCEHCSESFPSKMKRDYHIAKVHKDILLTCKICGHKAKKYCNFAIHKRMKHPEGNEQLIQCEHCPKSFKDKLYMNKHMKKHQYSKLGLDETLMCEECNVKFMKPSGLKRHLNMGHLQPKIGKCCEYCGKVLPTAGLLERHLLRHKGQITSKRKRVVKGKRKTHGRKSMVTLSSTTPSPVNGGECEGSENTILRRTRKNKVLENEIVHVDTRKFITEDNDHIAGGDKDSWEDSQQASNNVLDTYLQSSDEDSDGKAEADDANDTEWQPVSDGGESADEDEPILNQGQEKGDNDKDHPFPRIRKKKINCKSRAKRQKRNTTCTIDTSIPLQAQANDKPVIQKPVKTLYLIKCKLCVASFRGRTYLDAHMSLHSRNEGILCQQCGWLCSSERTLMNHCVKQHNKVRPPQAPWRPARKNTVPKFKYMAKDDIPYYCDHCHMIFRAKMLLLRHMEGYHANVAYLPCSYCDSKFPTKQILQIHCRDEHPSSDESKASVETSEEDSQEHNCEFCSECFPSKLKRDLHIAKLHKDMLLTCKICGFKAEKFVNFVRHKHAVHKEETEQFFCEHCARSFYDKVYLNQHMKLAHYTELGIDEPLTCKECSVKFISPSALKAHVNYVHRKIKEHCCEHCGKAFARVADLKQHILLHTAPREEQYKKGPFFCEFCQAKFNVRQTLYYHMKKNHTEQYAFKCDYCGTGYITQNKLSQHLRICKEKTK